MQQTIRFVTTDDNVRLAWAWSGAGPTLVRAATWITHLEYDWESPVWRHWVRFFSEHFHLLRYDERGSGLSQHQIDDLSAANWRGDLESVIAAAAPEKPFVLFGISQGASTSVRYALKHPEHVSHMVLYGGYAQGWGMRDDPDRAREFQALVDLAELGWGRPDPLYRRLFTKRFLPEGSEEQLAWFDELCAKTTRPAMAAQLLRERGGVDVREQLPKVRVPTLVIHAREDQVSPLSQGQTLAAGIPGAEFVQVDSPNHILLEHEPAWQRFREVVLEFTGVRSKAEDALFESLSEREREILANLCSGLTNAAIGKALFISEKTVRNHITRIFEKLGVANRSQAIVVARDKGFRP